MKRNKHTVLKLTIATSLTVLPVVSHAQSLWRDDISRAMYADKRGAGIGDILTIVVQENTTANKSNETKTERQSSLNAAISSFLYSPTASGFLTKGGQLPAMAVHLRAQVRPRERARERRGRGDPRARRAGQHPAARGREG